jgi:hypothetical protein
VDQQAPRPNGGASAISCLTCLTEVDRLRFWPRRDRPPGSMRSARATGSWFCCCRCGCRPCRSRTSGLICMWSEPYGSQLRYLAAFLHTRQVRRPQGEAGAPVTIVSLPGQRAGLEDEETVLTTMGDGPLILKGGQTSRL